MALVLRPVTSSNVAAIGHDPATNTLAVRFNSGATHHYHDVPAEVAAKVVNAPSVGSALHEHVKKGGYASTKQ